MKYRALFLGLTTIDIQYFVESFPESNRKVKTNPPEIFVGGPATNAAVAFAKLNNGTFLASPTGQNTFSEFIEKDFEYTGISHFDLSKDLKFNPVIASVITSLKNGDRNIFTHNPDRSQFEYSAEELFEAIQPEILLLDGFYPELALSCAKIAKTKQIPVVIDCGSWKPQYEQLLDYTDIAICSNDFYPPGCKSYEQVFRYLQNKKVDKVAITRGEDSIIYHNVKDGEVDVSTTEVADTLGAGDFIHGAFCFFYLHYKSFELALTKGSEMASFTCKFKGTREWINNFVK